MMAPAYPKKKGIKPGVQMRQLHWTKLPDAKVKGTMWENDMSDDKIKIDPAEVETLFAAAAAKKKDEDAEDDKRRKTIVKKAEVVTLIDPKTANNAAIALSRFKVPTDKIAAALLAGDSNVLSADSLTSLMTILPSAEEVELVQGHDGPTAQLGKCEQFFLAIASVPRYTIRTKCMLTAANFPERAHELKSKVEDVAAAVKEVRASKALKETIEFALAIGNYLNGGTNKGAAWGFKIDSLNKLIGTKTLDNKSTLLHYMARKLAEKGTVDALLDELSHIEPAARIVWKDESGELASLGTALKQVETQVKLDKNEAFVRELGSFHSTAKAEFEAISKAKATADEAATAMLKWLGEDAKVQPEEVFSTLHNFSLTIEKGHRYNVDMEEKEAKKKRMEAAAEKRAEEMASNRKRGGSVAVASGDAPATGRNFGAPARNRASTEAGGRKPPGPMGMGIGVDNELAAKLAKRAAQPAARVDLVDGVAKGMANGIRVRNNDGRSSPKPAKPSDAGPPKPPWATNKPAAAPPAKTAAPPPTTKPGAPPPMLSAAAPPPKLSEAAAPAAAPPEAPAAPAAGAKPAKPARQFKKPGAEGAGPHINVTGMAKGVMRVFKR